MGQLLVASYSFLEAVGGLLSIDQGLDKNFLTLLLGGCGGGIFSGAEEAKEESDCSSCWLRSSSIGSMCLSNLSLVTRSWLV